MSDIQKGRADFLEVGDWNAACSMCGRKRKASQMVQNWQGLYRCPEHNEPRQPQDFVRGVPDIQTPAWIQPERDIDVLVCSFNGSSGVPGFAQAGCMTPGRTNIIPTEFDPLHPPPPPPFIDQPTKLLLHFDGSGTIIVDSSVYANTVMVAGDATQASTWTVLSGFTPPIPSTPKFGSGALLEGKTAPGTGVVTVPFVAGGPLDITAGDFTIEGFLLNPQATDSQSVNYGIHSPGVSGLSVIWSVEPGFENWTISCQNSFGSLISQTDGSPGFGDPNFAQWLHFALVRLAGVLTLYWNGTSRGTAALPSLTLPAQPTVTFTSEAEAAFDEIRISNIARYTSNFTPPSAPFSPIG
jgi:hypothetical protein